MNYEKVTMVRIYLTEAEHLLDSLMSCLHEQEHVRGVTVFRGVSGFGHSGKLHTTALVDMSFDLPLVIEFFDSSARVDEILSHIVNKIKPGHIVTWDATIVT